MAEDSDNRWSHDRKALGLFRYTEAILFFGTPFRGIHNWFQRDLPRLAKTIVSGVQDDVFDSFRMESPMLNELRRDFVNKFTAYKIPNVGFVFETQDSKVGKIIGDSTVPMVRLVRRDSAILDGPETGEPRFLNCGLERHHFNMHDFGENDTAFASVESLLRSLLSLQRSGVNSFNLDLTGDEKSMRSFLKKCLSKMLISVECLQSLFFSEMNEREYNVIKASTNTCDWLSENPVYIDWFNQQHRLLWIKGNPGVGKSTLMKHVLKSTSMMKERNTIIAFFFHGRGTSLQKNLLGLFRSLLHQIALRCSSVLREFNDVFTMKCKTQGDCGSKWEWNQNELQELFISQVKEATKTHTVRIYIDALDECGEDASIHLVDIFQDVAKAAHICFSCRRYPLIALKTGLEINVEANNANDIKIYVSNQLGEQKNLAQIRDQILEKASGNFQWVEIVTKKVNDWRRKGISPKFIQKKIISIPEKLNQLYKELLSGIDELEKSESLHLMQWICYALRPLSLTELRFAMAVDIGTTCQSISECQASEQYVTTDEDMEKRVCHLSAGLAQVIWHNDKSTVQLIHQSVSDFFQDNKGFQLLHESQDWAPASSAFGCAHFRLSRSCIKYLSMKEFLNSIGWRSLISRSDQRKNFIRAKILLKSEFPFLEYATVFWIPHVKIVEEEGVSQNDLVSSFESTSVWQSWINSHNFFGRQPSPSPNEKSTILHIASQHGLLSVLKTLHQPDFDINDTDGNAMTPLCLAACEGHEAVVRWLLKWDNIETNAIKFRSPLIFAAQFGHNAVVKTLMERNDVMADFKDHEDRTPLSHAAEWGHETVVKLLLERNDVIADSIDYSGRTPLIHAALNGHEKVVKLLVTRNDVIADSKGDHDGRTSLFCAAVNGHEAVMEMLIERDDVDVNSKDNEDQMSLFHAIRHGHEKVIKLLMKRDDLDVNFKDKYKVTALHVAAEYEIEAAAELLLKRHNIDVNSRDDRQNTPLHRTAGKGHTIVMELLLKHNNVDVNSRNNHEQTPLHLTARYGHEAAMRLLLQLNYVDVNFQNKVGHTFLHQTAQLVREAMMTLLLERHDVDVNIKDNDGATPLHLTVRAGHEKAIQLLLEHNGDVNIKDNDGATPLHLAVRAGHEKSIKLLLEHNRDANIKDNDGDTPLHLALITANEAIVELLLGQKVDASLRNNDGDTLLDVAVQQGHEAIVGLLKSFQGT